MSACMDFRRLEIPASQTHRGSVLKIEVRRAERARSDQQNREVSNSVTVYIAHDLGVGSRSRIAQLAGNSREASSSDETECLITYHARVRIQEMQVDRVAINRGEIGDPVSSAISHRRIG